MIQIGLGLAAWLNGASRHLMNILHQSCLSMSYLVSPTSSLFADKSIEEARRVAAGPHGLGYDNINISNSIFVEQGPNTMSKVQSGTFAVIYYELLSAHLKDMKIQPMVENLNKAVPLKFTDLVPFVTAMHSYSLQTTINIINILFKYVAGFDDIKKDPILQHQPHHIIPKVIKPNSIHFAHQP